MSDRKVPRWKYTPVFYGLLLLTSIGFLALTYLRALPADTAGMEASISLTRRLSIVLPEILIWTIALVSALHLKQYAISIKGSPDAKGLNDISHALLVMTAYIIALTTGSTIVRLVSDTQYVRFAVLLRNHLPVILALIATILLFRGSRALVGLVPARLWTYKFLALMALPSWLFLITFTWQFYHAVPNIPPDDGIPRFSLPVKVLLFTYVLPHAVIWVLGLWSCINIAHYARLSPGSIYRSLFSSLARGILLVFACIFIAQFLIISSVAIARFSFATVMVYMTLLLIMIGFMLVFHGVEQLHKIEKTIR